MNRLLAGCLLLALSLTGCGEDADEPGSSAPSAQETTLQDCEGLLPTSVLETLGWSSGTPSLERGECRLTSDDGDVAVLRRPVASEADDAGAAALEERCAELDGAEDVDWVDGVEGQCAVVGPDDLDLGVLVVHVADRTVVEARVVPRSATSPEQVEAALVEAVAGFVS